MDDQIVKYIESIPGFRYHPTNEELMLALKQMILGIYDTEHGFIFQFDVCKHEPWELANLIDEMMKFKSNNREWYCFNHQTSKYNTSKRYDRTTISGYWKSTGKKRDIKSDDNELMGFKQILVFHKGRVPNGIKTGWVMHEYHLNADFLGDCNHKDAMPFVVCRIKCKKDRRGGAKASSSFHQDDHTINTNNAPITIESELDDEPVGFTTTPIEPANQLPENAWPQDSSEEFWESLEAIPMAPSNYYAEYCDNPYGTWPEVDNLWS